MMLWIKTIGQTVILRTCKVVIKQCFDDIRSEIDVNTVVFLATRHLSVKTLNG